MTASPAPARTSGLAIAALVLALAGWVASLPLLALLALGFGVAARRDISRSGKSGSGLAVAALIVAGLHLLFAAAFSLTRA